MINIGTASYKPNSFKFQIQTTTTSETFTLPLGGAGYTHNFKVYWGDGTSSTITAYNSADRIHTYATIGTYDIEINGTCQYFAFDNNVTYGISKSKVYKLLAFTGDVGFRTLNFYGCNNLNTLVPLGTLKSLYTAYNMFNSAPSNILTVPAGMFDGCPNIAGTQSFWNTFYNCSKLTTIPADLFRYNTKATSFNSVFMNCSKLQAIPDDLFKYNVLATDFGNAFNNCAIIPSIPTDLFRYNTVVYGFMSTFYRCYAITSIPTDIFRYNTLVTTFNSTFSDCTGISVIPTDIFRYNTGVFQFQTTFSGCSKITTIPADLFAYNTLATNFSSVFWNCSKITAIPTDLFRYNVSANNFNTAFSVCPLITSIPVDTFRYNTAVTNFGTAFMGCSTLASIPTDLFRYNTLNTSFAMTFSSCSALTAIPTDLFRYNPLVTSFTNVFFSCTSLASIPADLFRYNINCTVFTSALQTCPKAQLNSTIFCATGEESTRFLDRTASLLHFEGTNGSTTFTDDKGKIWTRTGLCTISTTYYKFGTASGLFDGASGISTPDHADFNFGSSDFTIDFWLRATATGQTNNSGVFGKFADASLPSPIAIYMAAGTYNLKLCAAKTSKWDLINAATIGAAVWNNWVHVAVVRSGTNIYTFLGGVLGSTNAIGTDSLLNEATSVWLGGGNSASTYFTGNIDEFRFTKGVAKWTSNFTPPSSAEAAWNVNFTNCFNRTTFTGVQGTAPDLWNYNFGTGTSTKTTCYGGAGNSLTSISNYADIPVAWK
jgi:hypothetical protein